MKKMLSVVVPFYNEVESLRSLYDELRRVRQQELSGYFLELIFMDNHSTDGSFELASSIAAEDPEVTVHRLSRNFGYQANIMAGLQASRGDAVVCLDADGEDDPRLIPQFLQKWQEGFAVVYGIRKSRAESAFLTLQRRIYYRLLRVISTVPIPLDAGDFRLLDRKVVLTLAQFKEANPYLRGLIVFAGFKSVGIEYHRRPRRHGESKFKWLNCVKLAGHGITSFSKVPLTALAWLGVTMTGSSIAMAGLRAALFLAKGSPTSGFMMLALFQLFLFGIQLTGAGILGIYLGRILDEVQARPRAIVEQTIQNPKRERYSA